MYKYVTFYRNQKIVIGHEKCWFGLINDPVYDYKYKSDADLYDDIQNFINRKDIEVFAISGIISPEYNGHVVVWYKEKQ